MQKETIPTIRREIQKDRLYELVKRITQHHRIQASDGYREAATTCASILQENGIETNLLSYPANGTDYAGSYKLFQEWNCKEAYCDLTYPKAMRLADFQLQPLSIIQKSYPCDYRNQEVELIVMDKGTTPEAYEGIDFQGKMIFIKDNFHEYDWAIEKGAIGFLSDFLNETPHVRSRETMQDSYNYTSFWWKHDATQHNAFGFVMTPRMGDELRKLASEVALGYEKGDYPSPYLKVSPFVDASLFDGHIEVVEAILPGLSDETILMSAHLCHPKASANDNASGVAGGLEIMRTLQALQNQQKLPKFQKTIKLILIPEFTGTFNYLCDGRDIAKYTSGINLDMIGVAQQDGYGPITITHLPYSCPHYSDSLACLLQTLIQQDTSSNENMQMSLVHTADVPFQLGSDHTILSDPYINIPAIMLGQWPDKHYHTSTDTIDKIDPVVLKYSTTLAACLVYFLANPTELDCDLLIQQIRYQFQKRCHEIALSNHQQKQWSYQATLTAFQQALQTLEKELPQYTSQLQEETKNLEAMRGMMNTSQEEERLPVNNIIYQRCFKTPITDLGDVLINHPEHMNLYRAYCKDYPNMVENHALLQSICDTYIDGVKEAQEIAKAVIAEVGFGDANDIYAYLTLLESVQLIQRI